MQRCIGFPHLKFFTILTAVWTFPGFGHAVQLLSPARPGPAICVQNVKTAETLQQQGAWTGDIAAAVQAADETFYCYGEDQAGTLSTLFFLLAFLKAGQLLHLTRFNRSDWFDRSNRFDHIPACRRTVVYRWELARC